jgi:predicted outer membrane repeat protein
LHKQENNMIYKGTFRTFVVLGLFFGGIFSPTLAKQVGDLFLNPQSKTSSVLSVLPGDIFYAAPSSSGFNNCSSWANACTLQKALSIAETGDEIWVKAGIYYPGILPSATFSLVDRVRVFGGFDGTETVRDQRDWLANITVLSGDIDGDDITDPNGVVTDYNNLVGVNSYHVVTSLDVSSNSMLDGFTITAGLANGGDEDDDGGGMYNTGSPTLRNLVFSGNYSYDDGSGIYNHNDSSPTLTNVTISGNYADGDGGGIYNRTSNSPTLTDVTISGNEADNDGGGIYNYQSSPTLADVTISNNSAYNGGGIYNYFNSRPTLTNVIISGNYSSDDGGGMYNVDSHPTLTNVTFSGNNSDEKGGGIYNEYSSPILASVTISGNNASYRGGGIYNDYVSNPILTKVTISDNDADYGGGMYNYEYSNPILTNVTISGNRGGHGGGVYNAYNSSPILTNVVISGNRAITDGGGVYCTWDSSTTLTNVTISGNRAYSEGGGLYISSTCFSTVQNSIIWNNRDSSGTGTASSSVFYSNLTNGTFRFSDVQGCGGSSNWNTDCGTDGGNNIDADPLLVRSDPSTAPSTDGDLHLQFPSPAIDAGDNSVVLKGVTTDLDGSPRFIDIVSIPDTGSGTPPIVDMGAYEFIFHVYLPLILR